MEKWVVEFAIEKADGTVRHESFESDNNMGVARLINTHKVKEGESLIYIDARKIKTLF